jgi:hypothetical protein
MKDIVKDIHDFKHTSEQNESEWYKQIGIYWLQIFVGRWIHTCSKPEDGNLSLDKYKMVGVGVSTDLNEYSDYVSSTINLLDKLGIQGLSIPCYVGSSDRYTYYVLTIEELNVVYNRLWELAGEEKEVNERPCKRCGKMNNMGAPVCWSFTCGVDNPTTSK